jgi:hypothetical protein
MAYSPVENKYLSALTAVQFPTDPVEAAPAPATEPQQAMAPGQRPGDILLAEVGSRGLPSAAYTGQYPSEIKPYDPTVRERLAGFLQAGFEGIGIDRYKARQNAETILGGPSSNLPLNIGLADFVPFLGTGLQTQEAVRMGEDAVTSVQQGNYGTAAMQAGGAALGLVPGAAGTAKAGMAVGRAAEKFAEKTVPEILDKGGTMAELLMALSQGSRSNLTAYHGTPHKVGKFDAKKIGSGEGAQAYGYGLYFAENKGVADGYRISLSYDPEKMKVGGKQINTVYDQIERAAGRIPAAQASGEYEKLELLERLMMNDMIEDVQKAAADMSPSTRAWFDKTVKPSFETYGNLYTVDIPDAMTSKMLDFDKPIGEQSPEIQALAKKYKLAMGDLGGDLLAAADGKTLKGADKLRDAGIPGVRYLDQGSRDSGSGTRNIVVFPGGEDQIKILKQEGNK